MTSGPERFSLTESDRNSALWLKLKAHLESKLHKLRLKNDQDADERLTALTRGEIRAYVSLIKLDQDKQD